MPETQYSYILEPYRGQRSRHNCPACRKPRQFTRYINTKTGAPLAGHVGKCNRLNNCGYHYTPREYFQDHPQLDNKNREWQHPARPYPARAVHHPAKEKSVGGATLTRTSSCDCIPRPLMEKTFRAYAQNNFLRYLASLFGQEKALELARQFHIGTSRHWMNHDGYATIFWQVDHLGNVRQAKVMAYHPESGRRLKAGDQALKLNTRTGLYEPDLNQGAKVWFAGKSLAGPNANLVQCFFGEHQLPLRPRCLVGIVESEKTAVLMSALEPDLVWLATGGINGARWTEKPVFRVLQGRQVIFYPDQGAYDDWSAKARRLWPTCLPFVSDMLEENLTAQERAAGFDLGDYSLLFLEQMKTAKERLNEESNKTTEEIPLQQGTPLPEGFVMVPVNGAYTLEVDGLPFGWLNEEEQQHARRRLAQPGSSTDKANNR